MKNMFLKLSVKVKGLMREEGQDLIEYALVVALIAFAATAGMNTLAGGINSAFNTISTKLTSSLSS
jgi:pilus assembly protein Flp/PilA